MNLLLPDDNSNTDSPVILYEEHSSADAGYLDPNTLEKQTYRGASRWLGGFLGALAVLSILIGWLVAGLPGIWGALIGIGLAGLFCGGTMWSITRTIGVAPISMAATIMLTWLAKLVILIGVLAYLRGRDFYNPYVLFAVIAIGVIGALVIQALTVKRSHLPYVTPN